MTLVLGLEHEGKVWLAGDAALSNGWGLMTTLLPKVFVRGRLVTDGRLVVGYAGSLRGGQIIEHHMPWGDVCNASKNNAPIHTVIKELVPRMRQALREHGWLTIEHGVEKAADDLEILIGVKGELYHIDSNFGVNRSSDGIGAIGSGFLSGHGALSALAVELTGPYHALELAMKLVWDQQSAVRPPFTILNNGED